MPKKATTRREEWVYVNIPRELAEKIDDIVDEQKSGYRSRSDFVADAIRRRLQPDREIQELRQKYDRLEELVQKIASGEYTPPTVKEMR